MKNNFKLGQLVVILKTGEVEDIIAIKKNNDVPFAEDEYKTAKGWYLGSELVAYESEQKFFFDEKVNAMAYVNELGKISYAEGEDVANDKYISAAFALLASWYGSRSEFEAWVDKIFDRDFKRPLNEDDEEVECVIAPKYEVGQRVLLIINSKEQMAMVEKVDWAGSEYVYIVSNENYSSYICCEKDIIRKCRACNSKKEN